MAYNYDQVEPPRLRWSEGYTVNLGDFESLRLDCSVEDTKRPNETVEEGLERLFNIVNNEIEQKVKAAKRTFRA